MPPRVHITDEAGLLKAIDHVGVGLWCGLLIRVDPVPLWIIGYWQLAKCVDTLRESVTIDGKPAIPSLTPVYTVSGACNVGAYVWFLAPNPHPAFFYLIYGCAFALLFAFAWTLHRFRTVCLALDARVAASRWTQLLAYVYFILLAVVAHMIFNIVNGTQLTNISIGPPNTAPLWAMIPALTVGVTLSILLLRAAWTATELTRDAVRNRVVGGDA